MARIPFQRAFSKGGRDSVVEIEYNDGSRFYAKGGSVKSVREVPLRRSGCFIATAAYGTPFADEINVLRYWRDNSLLSNTIGKYFVALYYKISPPIAALIEKSNFLKFITRSTLKPIVFTIKIFNKK